MFGFLEDLFIDVSTSAYLASTNRETAKLQRSIESDISTYEARAKERKEKEEREEVKEETNDFEFIKEQFGTFLEGLEKEGINSSKFSEAFKDLEDQMKKMQEKDSSETDQEEVKEETKEEVKDEEYRHDESYYKLRDEVMKMGPRIVTEEDLEIAIAKRNAELQKQSQDNNNNIENLQKELEESKQMIQQLQQQQQQFLNQLNNIMKRQDKRDAKSK